MVVFTASTRVLTSFKNNRNLSAMVLLKHKVREEIEWRGEVRGDEKMQ